jgi:hypothetical protein
LDLIAGDSIVAYDWSLRRLTLFTPRGRLVAAFKVNAGMFRVPRFVGALQGGTFIVAGEPRTSNPQGTMSTRDSTWFVRVDRGGVVLDTLMILPSRIIDVRPRTAGQARRQIPMPVHFSPEAVGVTHGALLYAGSSDAYSIGVYEPTGRLRTILRRHAGRRRVERGDVRLLLDRIGARYADRPPRERERELQIWESVPSAEFFPEFDRLLTDDVGNLWVRRYRAPSDTVESWDGFKPTGEWCCVLIAPAGAGRTVAGIGTRQVTVIGADSLGVEMVEVYRVNQAGTVK